MANKLTERTYTPSTLKSYPAVLKQLLWTPRLLPWLLGMGFLGAALGGGLIYPGLAAAYALGAVVGVLALVVLRHVRV